MSGGIFAGEAPELWAADLPVIPLLTNSKRPAIQRWQQYADKMPSLAEQTLWLYAHASGNIGLPLGGAAGVVALDVDNFPLSAMFSELSQAQLRPSFKRVGKKGAVFLFKYSGQKTKRYFLADGSTAFELLSTGTQIVLPPSIHPDTGQPYTSEESIIDAVRSAPELPVGLLDEIADRHGVAKRAVSRLSPVSTSVAVGGRDNACIQKIGVLAGRSARGEISLADAIFEFETWFGSSVEQPEDDHLPIQKYIQRLGEFFARDCTKCDATGQPIKFGEHDLRIAPLGWDDALTPGDLSRLDLLGVDFEIGSAIPLISRDYLLVANNRSFIHRETGEAVSGDHLVNMYSPYLDGSNHQRKLDELVASRQIQRVDFVRMRPGKPPGVINEPPYKMLNMFRGFSVSPAPNVADEDVRPFLELTRLQVPDPKQRKYLLDWEAHTFQFPDKPKATCPLLVSIMGGTGKNQRVEALGSLLHQTHFRVVTIDFLESRFTAWRKSTVLVFVDEVESGNRAQSNRVIKSIVGNAKYEHEQKYEASYQEASFNNLYLASNRLDAIRIDQGDRRYFVVEIDDEQHRKIVDQFSFVEFNEWLSNNRHKLLGWLLQRDISDFDPYAPAPVTDAKLRMQKLALPTWEALLENELNDCRGRFFKDIVCCAELADHLWHRHRLQVTANHIREWLKRHNGQCLGRHSLTYVNRDRGGFSAERVTKKLSMWVIRNHAKWRSASKESTLAEIGKDPFLETDGIERGLENIQKAPVHLSQSEISSEIIRGYENTGDQTGTIQRADA